MTDQKNTEGLSQEELAQQGSEELPEREEMSLINAKLAAPVNAACLRVFASRSMSLLA